MIKFEKIISILNLLFAFTACAKEEVECVVTVENPMLFGIEEIAQTKVAYGETDGKISATFKEDEELGLYAFYNNFYYYYTEYAAFAESVIFANQGLTVDESKTSATYSPLKSWTFSTLYGTAPHTLDAIAYYPFREGYNPRYVQIVHTYPDSDGVGGGAATLEYYYVDEGEDEESKDDDIVNADIDFMTAHKRYTGYADAEEFREEMLGLTSIPLEFTRQTASLNLKVTKPDDYATTIIVTGITVYFDAYKKFTQSVDADSKIVWSDMTSGYALTASKTCNEVLAETGWDDTPAEGESNEGVENLLEYDNMLFFPPDTEINKVVFTLTDDGVSKSYTWHPHVATFVANTHYTLNLELDPSRAN